MDALLMQSLGKQKPREDECRGCADGRGPFRGCFVMEGWAMGACANCWFNATPQRCRLPSSSPAGSCSQPKAKLSSKPKKSVVLSGQNPELQHHPLPTITITTKPSAPDLLPRRQTASASGLGSSSTAQAPSQATPAADSLNTLASSLLQPIAPGRVGL
jgi:hypothetical protein